MERPTVTNQDRSAAIVSELRRRLDGFAAERGDRIREKRGLNWIGWGSVRRDRTFAEVRPHRHRVEVFIRPPVRSLSNPTGLARPAPPSQGWGWFRSRFSVSRPGQIGPAFQLLKQSYSWTRTTSEGKRPRRRTRRGRQTV